MTRPSIDTAEDVTWVESRSETRRRVFLKGHITFNHGAASLDCLVRDLSPSGARLVLSDAVALPKMFDLYIPQKVRTLQVTLSWRREQDVGVTFAEDSSLTLDLVSADAASEKAESMREMLLDRIGELEAENLALRRSLLGKATSDGVL